MKENLIVLDGPLSGINVNLQIAEGKIQKIELSERPECGLKINFSGDGWSKDLFDSVVSWFRSYQHKELEPSILEDHFNFPNLTHLEAKALKAMKEVPFGSLKTYKELGIEIGSKDYARFIGSVCRKNPFPIIFPCHRIVSAKGMGGYSPGIRIKEKLLKHEGAAIPKLVCA